MPSPPTRLSSKQRIYDPNDQDDKRLLELMTRRPIDVPGKTGKISDMITARLSSKGQLVIPKEMRRALHLKAGDHLRFSLENGRLVLEPDHEHRARLVKRRGRRLLVAPAEAPTMTTHEVKKLLSDFP